MVLCMNHGAVRYKSLNHFLNYKTSIDHRKLPEAKCVWYKRVLHVLRTCEEMKSFILSLKVTKYFRKIWGPKREFRDIRVKVKSFIVETQSVFCGNLGNMIAILISTGRLRRKTEFMEKKPIDVKTSIKFKKWMIVKEFSCLYNSWNIMSWEWIEPFLVCISLQQKNKLHSYVTRFQQRCKYIQVISFFF